MSESYEPGAVQLMRVDRWPSAREWPDDTSQVLMRLDEDGRFWSAVEGDPAAPFCVNVNMTDYYRPLVVLDLDDREQMDALCKALVNAAYTEREFSLAHSGIHPDTVTTALRSLSKPPKPAEPTGLGAVVEDSKGRLWTNTGKDMPNRWACATDFGWVDYPEIDAVRVLSQGVNADDD